MDIHDDMLAEQKKCMLWMLGGQVWVLGMDRFMIC